MAGPVNLEGNFGHSFNFTGDCSNLWNEDDVVQMDVFTACSIGQYGCVQQHLADGMELAELDSSNYGGWTPLMYAAYVGHDNIVNLLLDCHVNVNARTTKNAATPLMLAASCGNESVVYFLLQNGAKIDAQDKRGWTALFYATFQGHQNVVKLLSESNADKDLRERYLGLTPLLAAAKEGHEVIYEMLSTNGACTSAKTNTGESARSLALQHKNMAIVNIIDQQSICNVPNYFLRSEPGLLPDDSELETLGGMPFDERVQDWQDCGDNGLETGIQDGPEAFAKLMNSHRKDVKPMNIPALQGKHDGINYTAGSPYHFSITPSNSEGTVGSYEEHFFINCGTTVESASLHKQLQKMNLEGENSGALQGNHTNCIPSFKPTVASFLQELKLLKCLPVFEEQDVDFDTLLTFTDKDLKEIGITLFGPRRKIFTALSRWKKDHENSNMQWNITAVGKVPYPAPSELQQLQAQLSQEKQLRVVAEGCVMEERAKRQEIYSRVCELQEQWKQTEGELEKLKALRREISKSSNLPSDEAQELQARLEMSISNLSKLASLGTVGTSSLVFGNQHAATANSSESSQAIPVFELENESQPFNP